METKQEKLKIASNRIASEIFKMHEKFGCGYWEPLAGQWLVYNFERILGFSNAISLESICETAWKQKKSQAEMETEIFDFLNQISNK